jgi:lipoic acid synthetase
MTTENIEQHALAGETAEGTAAWPTEALLFTQLPFEEARKLQEESLLKIYQGDVEQHQMLVLEHPPTFVYGEDAGEHALGLLRGQSHKHDMTLALCHTVKGVEYRGPGQLAVYLAFSLRHWRNDIDAFVEAVEEIVLRTLADFGLAGERQPDGRAVRVGGRSVATIQTRLRRDVATVRLTINTNTDLSAIDSIREILGSGLSVSPEPNAATLAQLGVPVERQDDVRASVLRHYEAVLGSPLRIPQKDELRTAKPPWLRARLPFAMGTERVHQIIGDQRLHTVCESAHCPNMGECWRHGTATFMINGNVCTRSCSFCAIFTGRPRPIDPDEPRRLAEAAKTMGIQYVVVTAVNRDELKDGGASQFVATIRELRQAIPEVAIEVLIPDFRGVAEALDAVFAARPDVLNHNIETVPRLYKRVRPQARYQRSLDVIARAKAAGLVTKSGFMLGFGEEPMEIDQTLRDLRAHGCDIVTIGQYLRPSEKHHPLIRYVTPQEFEQWREHGLSLGFRTVESGPLVRSSYHAHLSYRRHLDGNG